MAGTSNYRILLETRINKAASEAGITADIAALGKNKQLLIGVRLDAGDADKLKKEMERIQQSAKGLGKVQIFADDDGRIRKAVLSYTDQAGKAVQQTIMLNDKIKATHKFTEDLVAQQRNYNKILKDSQNLTAKQSDEMKKAAQLADRFLARAGNMNQTESVKAAMQTAESIKQAVAAGDIQKVRQLTDAFATQRAGITQLGTGFQQLTASMGAAMRRTVEYSLSVGALMTALRGVQEGIEYIADLNKEMTNIQLLQVEGAQTDEQIGQLANRYNELAQALGATTIQVAQGSVEWLRQGKTIEQTEDLLRATMMLSKLGALDSAEATEYLTATLNGFHKEAADAEDIVSKLVAIDNIAATSAGELATAMKRSSAVANEAGVSFESLAAMIGAVSSNTRLSAEMIGTAFRSMFVRMQQVKAGGIDETGKSLNNVEKTLSSVGIALRDSVNSFRPLEEVIADVAGKWDTLNEVQKAQIANAIAGQRQAQIFSSLMQNWGDVTTFLAAETDSLGLAQQRYGIYLNSVEAAQNRAKASMEGMWQATINSDAIKFLYDFGAGIFDLIASLGGLQNIILLAVAGLVLFKAQLIGSTIATFVTSIWGAVSGFIAFVAQVGVANAAIGIFNTLLYTNPLGLIIGALALAIGAFALFNESIEDSTNKVLEFQNSIQSIQGEISKLNKDKDRIKELHQEFLGLSEGTERWYQVQSELKDLLPQVNGYYDEQGRFIIENAESLEELLALKEQEIQLEKDKLALDAKKGYKEEVELFEKLLEEREKYVKILNQDISPKSKTKMLDEEREQFDMQLEETNIKIRESEIRLREFFNSLTIEEQKLMLQAAEGTKIYEILTKKIEAAHDAANQPTSPLLEEEGFSSGEVATDALEDLQDLVIQMIKDRKEAEKDALREELRAFKDQIDDRKDALKDLHELQMDSMEERKTSLDREYKDQKRIFDLQKDEIKEQLDSYKEILDARKDLLRAEKESRDFERSQGKREDELARIESQIAELQFDTSEEGVARRLELEAEASALRLEMAEDLADEEYRLQLEALDAEASAAEEAAETRLQEIQSQEEDAAREHELRQRELEDEKRIAQEAYEFNLKLLEEEYEARETVLQRQIQQIDSYLKQEGTIRRDAMEMLKNENSSVFQELIEWNNLYGTGVREDIVSAWEAAAEALKEYRNSLEAISNTPATTNVLSEPTSTGGVVGDHTTGGHTTTRHTGIETGFVGGKPLLKSNEEFAKLLQGELVVNPKQMDNYMKNILPQTVETTSNFTGGNIELSMPITIQGNLDKTCLPDLEKIADKVIKKLNDTMISRGYNRRADSFGGV